MSRKRDTDTLTRIDLTPDAPTIKQDAAGADAETHQLDPRVWAPLRVCPQCSLAWEVTGDWCPSCGTAFDKSARESATPTRVMSQTQVARRHPAEPPLTRSARRQRAAAANPPPAAPNTRQPKSSSGAGRTVFTVLAICAVAIVAFLVGQSTRPSNAQVDQRVNDAVTTAKKSAAESYTRAFDQMQARAAKAIADARRTALAEGEAKAQAQLQQNADNSQSIFDSVTACVLHGSC